MGKGLGDLQSGPRGLLGLLVLDRSPTQALFLSVKHMGKYGPPCSPQESMWLPPSMLVKGGACQTKFTSQSLIHFIFY